MVAADHLSRLALPTHSSPEVLAALKEGLPPVLPQFLERQRWFGGKARTISAVEVVDIIPFSETLRAYVILAQVQYASGPAETYDILLAWPPDGPTSLSDSSMLRIQSANFPQEIILKDALTDDLSVVQERVTALEQMLVESLDADEPGWGTHGASPTTIKMASA